MAARDAVKRVPEITRNHCPNPAKCALIGARERLFRLRKDLEGHIRGVLKTFGIRMTGISQGRQRQAFRDQLAAAGETGSDSILVQLRRSSLSGRFNEPGSEQIDVRPTIHLALEGLEAVDLSLGLPVRPWFPQSCGDRSLISPKPAGEGAEQAFLRLIQPCVQRVFTSIAHHIREPVRQPTGCGKGWQCGLDPCDLDGICPAKVIPAHGQQARNPAGRRRLCCA